MPSIPVNNAVSRTDIICAILSGSIRPENLQITDSGNPPSEPFSTYPPFLSLFFLFLFLFLLSLIPAKVSAGPLSFFDPSSFESFKHFEKKNYSNFNASSRRIHFSASFEDTVRARQKNSLNYVYFGEGARNTNILLEEKSRQLLDGFFSKGETAFKSRTDEGMAELSGFMEKNRIFSNLPFLNNRLSIEHRESIWNVSGIVPLKRETLLYFVKHPYSGFSVSTSANSFFLKLKPERNTHLRLKFGKTLENYRLTASDTQKILDLSLPFEWLETGLRLESQRKNLKTSFWHEQARMPFHENYLVINGKPELGHTQKKGTSKTYGFSLELSGRAPRLFLFNMTRSSIQANGEFNVARINPFLWLLTRAYFFELSPYFTSRTFLIARSFPSRTSRTISCGLRQIESEFPLHYEKEKLFTARSRSRPRISSPDFDLYFLNFSLVRELRKGPFISYRLTAFLPVSKERKQPPAGETEEFIDGKEILDRGLKNWKARGGLFHELSFNWFF